MTKALKMSDWLGYQKVFGDTNYLVSYTHIYGSHCTSSKTIDYKKYFLYSLPLIQGYILKKLLVWEVDKDACWEEAVFQNYQDCPNCYWKPKSCTWQQQWWSYTTSYYKNIIINMPQFTIIFIKMRHLIYQVSQKNVH